MVSLPETPRPAGGIGVGLPPEVRQRILQEERIRAEARERFDEEIRLRKRDAAFVVRVLSLIGVFAVALTIAVQRRQERPQP